jgi:dihydrofolate reductase
MIVAFVVAMAENGVIGRNGQLPWRMPSDLKQFRKLTLRKPVVMGRKTYESIGKPLDGRDNIVITRQKDFAPPGVRVADTIAGAVALGRTLASRRGVNEVAIIGGAEVFRAALPLTQRVYLTLVHGRPEGDIMLDSFDPAGWREASREPMQQTAGDPYSADLILMDRQP